MIHNAALVNVLLLLPRIWLNITTQSALKKGVNFIVLLFFHSLIWNLSDTLWRLYIRRSRDRPIDALLLYTCCMGVHVNHPDSINPGIAQHGVP